MAGRWTPSHLSPILHDTMAAEAVKRIDFDFTKTGLRRGDPAAVALRASQFDGWAREFLVRTRSHRAAPGRGLDTRVYRLDPGPDVRWFDLDYPDVIDLRRSSTRRARATR